MASAGVLTPLTPLTPETPLTDSDVARDGDGDAVSGEDTPTASGERDADEAGEAGEVGTEVDDKKDDPMNAYFECNICLELALDPVVTQCGHLYCWPCIYKWLQVFPEAQQCPVCKAGVSEELVRATFPPLPKRKAEPAFSVKTTVFSFGDLGSPSARPLNIPSLFPAPGPRSCALIRDPRSYTLRH